MIQNCKMRHENGNCLPAGGFCTANKNICEALQNAYEMGQRNVIRKKGKWKGYNGDNPDWQRTDGSPVFLVCSECGATVVNNFAAKWNYCCSCGARMEEEHE